MPAVATRRPPDLIDVHFTWMNASPLTLASLKIGQLIEFVDAQITTPFDDPSATLQVGTSADPGMFLDPSQISTSIIGQYANDEISRVTVADVFILTISPMTSSQGEGHLYYRIKG